MEEQFDTECPFYRHPIITILLSLGLLITLALQVNFLWSLV